MSSSTSYMREYRRKRRAFVATFKNRPCEDCGNRYPPECMDFDHIERDDKAFNIAMNLHKPIATLKAEMAKCDVICANCHRIRTRKQRETND